ncbi:hypothetical protein ACQPZQ_14600 [Pseudonocardia sp. CA-142604]|uniref:hypothetical protein n=1 Tax=Pseudonocardia sp. CA-142604 TaxID=3240024 RepID=UPI003D9469E3
MGRHHISVEDEARSWILPHGVRANIPLRGSHGMLGAHNAARGLLVEICRHTGAVPLCLHYHEAAHRRGTLTIVAVLAWGDDRFLLVSTRTFTDWRKTGDDRWSICINGHDLPDEDRHVVPSVPLQAAIVDRWLNP